MLVSLGEAALMLGVCPATLRRWDRLGEIAATRTPGNHRRFDSAELLRLGGNTEQATKKIDIGYARANALRPSVSDNLHPVARVSIFTMVPAFVLYGAVKLGRRLAAWWSTVPAKDSKTVLV
jgi:excisionase family DNA binding protein